MGRRHLALAAALMLSTGLVPARAEDGPTAATAAVVLPAEAGAWRTRSQPVYDPVEQALRRTTYTVWDPVPSRRLEFTWLPDDPAGGDAERPTGTGRLVWRLPGKPAYDPASVFAEYRGMMRDGRPEGLGEYRESSGLGYQGEWRDGRPDGDGTLTLGGGAEYRGRVRAGAAEGEGRFYDVDGEIFEGPFRAGLRDGRGRTLLPGGGAYLSEWARGLEVAASRKVRIAQLGPGGAANEDVRLGITVERVADTSALQYTTANSGTVLLIRPSRERLMAVWKGDGDIQLSEREEAANDRGSYGVFAYATEDLPPLTLVFEVQNRAAAPVQVRGAYLDVDSSASDLQPAIQMSAGSSGECSTRPRSDFSPKVELENYGWASADGARLQFAFAVARSNVPAAAQTVGKDVGTIKATRTVDFEPELRAAGVKTDILKRRAEAGGIGCRSRGNANACLGEIVATGYFGTLGRQLRLEGRDIVVSATGSLNYGWKAQTGEDMKRTSPFSARLLLGRTPVEAECGEGAEREPVRTRPLEFRLDQTKYRLPLAFDRTVRAGGSARYTVQVAAAKSSEHKFRVVLQTADNRLVTSRPITLTYFRPSRTVDLNAAQ